MSVRVVWPILAIGVLVAACSAMPAAPAPTAVGEPLARTMTVYRSPDCSCCHLWADIARADGWTVATVNVLDMTEFKARNGIPLDAASCHTAIVDGYVVEGHVPMAALERLITERPAIDGIALPGMPAGSPGMGGAQEAPFEVLSLTDGDATAFGSY